MEANGNGTGSEYERFLASKAATAPAVGFEVADKDLSPALFDFQRRVTQWACLRGWAAIFAECGMGKSICQLDWCRQVFENATHKPGVILAPLGVTMQLQREGEKFGIPLNVLRTGREKLTEINVCNYERLHLLDPADFSFIDLDEAGILKGFTGKFRRDVTRFAHQVEYRLSASATPAPNDLVELTTQAEFLGIMSAKEVCGEFFRTEGEVSTDWVLKPHARDAFYNWLASWAVALRKPSDLGFSDEGFELPTYHRREHYVEAPLPQNALFRSDARGIQQQREVNRETITERAEKAAEFAFAYPDDPLLLWCNLNAEGEALRKAIPSAIEVRGSQSIEEKEAGLFGFSDGTHRVLISKPSICGHGMNWQHCNRAAFVGLSNSFEQMYQAWRRIYRYGQKRECFMEIIVSDADGPVLRNIARKEAQAAEMMAELVTRMATLSGANATRQLIGYEPAQPMQVPHWIRSEARVSVC